MKDGLSFLLEKSFMHVKKMTLLLLVLVLPQSVPGKTTTPIRLMYEDKERLAVVDDVLELVNQRRRSRYHEYFEVPRL
jgi:hypothetical protein